MASQMADCQQDTVSVTVYAGGYRFKASGYTVTFDGFTALYEEATERRKRRRPASSPRGGSGAQAAGAEERAEVYPAPRPLHRSHPHQGAGRERHRPSLHLRPIITTIIDRGYVEREQKKLKPTLLGRAVDG